MFKNRAADGKKNIVGQNIKRERLNLKRKPSQRQFAEMLQISGLDIDKNAIQKMEAGKRFVTDIELKIIAEVLNASCDELLSTKQTSDRKNLMDQLF